MARNTETFSDDVGYRRKLKKNKTMKTLVLLVIALFAMQSCSQSEWEIQIEEHHKPLIEQVNPLTKKLITQEERDSLSKNGYMLYVDLHSFKDKWHIAFGNKTTATLVQLNYTFGQPMEYCFTGRQTTLSEDQIQEVYRNMLKRLLLFLIGILILVVVCLWTLMQRTE